MTSKTFVSGTVIDSAWLNDVNDATYSSSSTYTPPGTGAVPTTAASALNWNSVNVFRFMTAAQIADVRAYTYTLDTTVAFAAATAALVVLGGGDLIAPAGGYLLNGSAGLDTYKNGILLPDTNGDFTTRKGIRLIGEGVGTIFRAGSADMIVVRHSRLYSGGMSYKIDGNSLSNVIGLALVPESMTQTTEHTSQSFAVYHDIKIENCTEGMLLQPGPTVAGSDSGAFYHRFYNFDFNLNTRHIWMKGDVTGNGNRTTRTSFYGCTITRGNTGVQIDAGTEIDFHSLNMESINSGVTPSATPTAFNYAAPGFANIRLFGGYAENCTKNITSIHPEQVLLYGFSHSGVVDTSEYDMLSLKGGTLNIPRSVAAGNPPINISGVNPSYAGFTVDPDSDGSKTLVATTNGVIRTRWFNGAWTHYGSAGNVVLPATGSAISFSKNGTNSIEVLGAAGSLDIYSKILHLKTEGSVSIVTAEAGYFYPETDNVISLGLTGRRWSSVWAANGTIQTSDPRTKKEVIKSPLGLDFIMKLEPVAYKFKVGGNEVVGIREITPAVMRFDSELDKEVIDIPAVTENVVQSHPGKRQHFGFLTTNVKTAMGDVDFGGYVKTDPDDQESEEALRYDEFIAPLTLAIQQQQALIQTMQDRLKVLEAHI